jgi:predicted alpha/beta superfamily hydrolase
MPQRFSLLIPLLGAAALVLHAGGASAFIRMEVFPSAENGRSYTIYTHIPDDYGTARKRYPVVYMLDGDLHFDGAVNLLTEMSGGIAGEMILVGIGYGGEENRRKRDYTPTRMKGFPDSGGVKEFYSFLRGELIPYIDGEYQTIASPEGRCIAGHSLGGIAVLYGLIFHGDLFRNYISISPSLWWDGRLFFKYGLRLPPKRRGEPVRIYTAVGSLEDGEMLKLSKRFYRRLRATGRGDLALGYAVIEGRRHDDVVVEAIGRGIGFIFQRRRGAPDERAASHAQSR